MKNRNEALSYLRELIEDQLAVNIALERTFNIIDKADKESRDISPIELSQVLDLWLNRERVFSFRKA